MSPSVQTQSRGVPPALAPTEFAVGPPPVALIVSPNALQSETHSRFIFSMQDTIPLVVSTTRPRFGDDSYER